MRRLVFTMGLLVTSGIGAHAYEVIYPWCKKEYGTNCGFSTLAQCQASIIGGTEVCFQNPAYVPPPRPAAGVHKEQKHTGGALGAQRSGFDRAAPEFRLGQPAPATPEPYQAR